MNKHFLVNLSACFSNFNRVYFSSHLTVNRGKHMSRKWQMHSCLREFPIFSLKNTAMNISVKSSGRSQNAALPFEFIKGPFGPCLSCVSWFTETQCFNNKQKWLYSASMLKKIACIKNSYISMDSTRSSKLSLDTWMDLQSANNLLMCTLAKQVNFSTVLVISSAVYITWVEEKAFRKIFSLQFLCSFFSLHIDHKAHRK